MAKPFIKWVGGKGKLLHTLEQNLPADFNDQPEVTYIEPFVGGGAMLFYMLGTHPNIRRAIINDINPALINCYRKIQNEHEDLLVELHEIEEEYYANPDQETRGAYYYALREEYNDIPVVGRDTVRAAALFIALNRTCFNGLYRENRRGLFNVPFGRYVHPTICNEQVINEAHEALQNVEICLGNYADVLVHVDWEEYNFFYCDPPYRPLLGANNFKDYTMNGFGDPEQEALKGFCDIIHAHGGKLMVSNSDSEREPGINYFEELYAEADGYNHQHIFAPRTINAFVPGVEQATEILIRNYE